MIAYKGFQKDLKCRGFQFQEYGINETEKANCRQNGFHCAENPLDCLCYYPNWKNSVYYIVDASGDLDEDGEDSKISCTKMRLLKKIELRSLLLHGAAYMAKYPNRKWNSHVAKEMKRGIRRKELEEKYVGFQKHLIDLKEKYEFSDGEYLVIAPKSIDDILYEGDTLHHCVNKTDTYFDRIVSKESYILFLREKENPKVPFYTLEVEPDGTIRQKRAEFNRQNKDIDKVTSFLTLWQKEIQKRLTKKDRKSTEESRKLRQQNYQEIRDKHVVVHGGAFAGELLADLLEKDLMDLPVESAENEESPTEIAA